MEQNEMREQPTTQSDRMNDAAAIASSSGNSARVLPAQQAGGGCSSCGGAAPGLNGVETVPAYVFAIGRIEMRFPSLAVEKEFAQATGRANTVGLTDRQAVQSVLAERSNRYLARQVCWILTIEGLETYILRPRDPSDFDLLMEAVRAEPSPIDVDVVIGLRGPVAPPEFCNGLMLPIIAFDQLYSFAREPQRRAIAVARSCSTAFPSFLRRRMRQTDSTGIRRILLGPTLLMCPLC